MSKPTGQAHGGYRVIITNHHWADLMSRLESRLIMRDFPRVRIPK